MQQPTPPTIRFCGTEDQVQLAYSISGKGTPIVFMGNWITHLGLGWDSPVWRHWYEFLSNDHELLRYDMRGCGMSQREVDKTGIDHWVADLETVRRAAGLDRFAIMAISQSTAVAVRYAARYPERVSRLLLHGGYMQGRHVREPSQYMRREADAEALLVELGWGRTNSATLQYFTAKFLPEGDSSQWHWYNDLQRHAANSLMAARILRSCYAVDVEADCTQVRCPVLVTHSDRDMRVPLCQGQALARHIPGSTFVHLDSPNHILLQDEPAWQRFRAAAGPFLEADQPSPRARLADLLVREMQVLELLARGQDNPYIGARLFLADKTVRNYVSSLLDKLAVDTRSQAIVVAREAGFGRPRAA